MMREATTPGGKTVLVNMGLVTVVEEFVEGQVALYFSREHKVVVVGKLRDFNSNPHQLVKFGADAYNPGFHEAVCRCGSVHIASDEKTARASLDHHIQAAGARI